MDLDNQKNRANFQNKSATHSTNKVVLANPSAPPKKSSKKDEMNLCVMY